MNTQVSARIGQIKQYISSLNDHVTANDHHSTLNIVNRFKKAVLKEDPQLHANQFLLDCLKTKNQKLQGQLQELQLQKKNLQQKLTNNKNVRNNMKEVNLGVFISRLSVSLNDVKKVQYDEVTLKCSYQKLYINSLSGNKYKDYTLSIDLVENVEYKHFYAHIQYRQTHIINILIRFQNDKEMQRWVTGLKFGMLIQSSKKKDKLFQVKRQESPISSTSSPQQNASPMPQMLSSVTNHIPTLSFGMNKANSPSQSIISQKKDKQKSSYDKIEKNSERSLVNALNIESNNMLKSTSRRSLHPSPMIGSKRLELNRPPNLTKIGGLSQNMENSFEISKIYKKNQTGVNSRKQSEDIWRPIINQNYHDKMLQTLRSQEANDSQQKSENSHNQTLQTFRPQAPKQQTRQASKLVQINQSEFRSSRLKSLQEKKKQLLHQFNDLTIPGQKSMYQFDNNKVSWGGIQEMDDQNKSKSSNKFSNRQKRESNISQSQYDGSKQSIEQKKGDKQSEHITEKSEEQSPKTPKAFKIQISPSVQAPSPSNKIKYEGGLGIQLHPVQKKQSKAIFFKTGSETSINKQKKSINQEKSKESHSQISESQSYNHSDSFSHQNHTESQDNNQRAEQLKKGIILTKYSENGFWPHQKIIYLSENQNDICYRDLKDKKIKKIKITKIKSVEYKRYDKGIIKHVAKIQDDRCLVIRAEVEDAKPKNFQFVSAHPQPLQRFASNLNLWMQYLKKN